MSRKKAKMSRIDVNYKFPSFEEAHKEAKGIKKMIKNICRSEKGKCEAIIGISNIIGRVVTDYYRERTGKVGRPPVKIEVLTDEEKIREVNFGKLGESGELGNVYVGYHLHILMITYPGETLRKEIRKLINKRLKRLPKLYTQDLDPNYIREVLRTKKVYEEDEKMREEMELLKREVEEKEDIEENEKKVYGKNCDIRYAEYIFKQSEKVVFVNENYSDYEEDYSSYFEGDFLDSIHYPCSLENLYNERLRLNTLYHYEELTRKEKERAERYYNEMINHYKQYCKAYTDKWLKEFIKSKYN